MQAAEYNRILFTIQFLVIYTATNMVDNQEQIGITLNVFDYPPGFKEMKRMEWDPGKICGWQPIRKRGE